MRRITTLLVLAAIAMVACGGSSGGSSASPGGAYKAAWIYVGSKSDAGWTKAHDDARLYVEQQLGGQVKTTFKENVPEGPQVTQVIDTLVADGNKIIFGTSFGFHGEMAAAAKKYPNVYFEQATAFELDKNLAQFFGAAEDADYLTGMAAGAATKSGKIGFVAPFAIPEVIREINAFALGAQATHPGATVQVIWTTTWLDPAKEKAAAESLISAGVDVLGQGQDSPATGEAAKAHGLKWSGYDSDQTSFAPDQWLTGTVYHWGPYELARVKAAMDGTWKSGSYYGSMKDGFVDIAPFGKSVDAATQSAINAKKQALIAGSFYEFTGPLNDQSGAVKVPAGTKLTLEQILTMDWFVKGVIGNPKPS
ncbi:MAG: BMP family ABC transporter substrate-binding protein [Candidatus Dormibacteraeota bacterium]|nr:BMP family ABC transporter substrate-binding protein [Candidatus Dormibacteraeota bacterium]